jgi:flagellar hook-length control protein FliK
MLFNFTNGREMQKRMDRVNDSSQDQTPGFATQATTKKSFENICKRVADSNKDAGKSTEIVEKWTVSERPSAKRVAERTTDTWENADKTENGKTSEESIGLDTIVKNFSEINPGGMISEVDPGKGDVDNVVVRLDLDDAQLEQATEVIKQALLDISSMLNLKLVDGLDKISFENVSEETIGQLSEVIQVLKGLTEALDLTAQANIALEEVAPGANGKDAAEVASFLKTELFKIELGLNLLGIGEKVQLKQDTALATTGIPQASDLSMIQVPKEQIARIFDKLIEKTDTDLSALTKNSQELNATGKSVMAVTEVIPEKQGTDLSQYDSQTYREILKIEKKELVALENSDAAESSDTLSLAAATDSLIASDVNSLQNTNPDVLPVTELGGTGAFPQQNVSVTDTRLGDALTRTADNTVVNQIAEKLSSSIRSGLSEIRIQLRPEALGEVRLAIRMDGDIVTARIQVENQQVKQIVESNLQSLKDSLAEHNLQAGSFDVDVGTGWKNQSEEQKWTPQKTGITEVENENFDNNKASVESSLKGKETGRRFGNNSIEFFG